MRSVSKRLAIPILFAVTAVSLPSAAFANGTCPGDEPEIVLGAHPGKLAKIDLNGDGIICADTVKVEGKHAKPTYHDNG